MISQIQFDRKLVIERKLAEQIGLTFKEVTNLRQEDKFYITSIDSKCYAADKLCIDSGLLYVLADGGLVHKTLDGAEAHKEALLSLSPVRCNESKE